MPPKPIHYGTSALKAGLLAGIASYSMILALQTRTPQWRSSPRASANGRWEWMRRWPWPRWVLGALLDTTNLKKDIVSFIFGDKGLMGDVSFSGSRFKKQEIE